MKTVTLIATAALLLAAVSDTTSAQRKDSSRKFIKPPVFLIMPGALTSCTISCPAGISRTDFNMRFQTNIPTASSWLIFVAGMQWGWFKDEAHGPLGFFGAIIPIVPLNEKLDGWLAVSFDPLGVTSGPGTGGTNLFLEGALVSPLGAKLWPRVSYLNKMGAYFLLDQQMTNLPLNATGGRDHWNPVLVYGLYWQVAP